MGSQKIEQLKQKLGRRRDSIVLAAIIAITTISNLYWLKIDGLIPDGDQAVYLKHSIVIRDFLMDGKLLQAVKLADYKPPLLQVSSIPIQSLLGFSPDNAMLVNLVFLAVLTYSTYRIGRYMHSAESGLLAAFAINAFPAVFGLSREFLQELGMVSMAALATFALLESERFQELRYSLVFGAAAAAGMLIKWSFAVFILVPAIYAIPFRLHEIREIDDKLEYLLSSIRMPPRESGLVLALSGFGAGGMIWSLRNTVFDYYIEGNFIEFLQTASPMLKLEPSLLIYGLLFSALFIAASRILIYVLHVATSRPLESLNGRSHVYFLPFLLNLGFIALPFLELSGTGFLYFFVLNFGLASVLSVAIILLELVSAPVEGKTGRYRNFLISGIVGSGIASIWYLPNLPTLIQNLIFASVGHSEIADPVNLTLQSFLYYPLAINNVLVFPALTLIGILGFTGLYLSRDSYRHYLLAWLVSIIGIFSVVTNKEPRFAIGVIIPVALAIGYGITSIDSNKLRYIAVIAVVVIGSAQYAGVSYGYGPDLSYDTGLGPVTLYSTEPYTPYFKWDYIHHAYEQDWESPMREVLDTINESASPVESVEDNVYPYHRKDVEVLPVSCGRVPHGASFFYYNYRDGYGFKFHSTLGKLDRIRSYLRNNDSYRNYLVHVPCHENRWKEEIKFVPDRKKHRLENAEQESERFEEKIRQLPMEKIDTVEFPGKIQAEIYRAEK